MARSSESIEEALTHLEAAWRVIATQVTTRDHEWDLTSAEEVTDLSIGEKKKNIATDEGCGDFAQAKKDIAMDKGCNDFAQAEKLPLPIPGLKNKLRKGIKDTRQLNRVVKHIEKLEGQILETEWAIAANLATINIHLGNYAKIWQQIGLIWQQLQFLQWQQNHRQPQSIPKLVDC